MADQPNGTNGHPPSPPPSSQGNGVPPPANRISVANALVPGLPVWGGPAFTESQARILDTLVTNATTIRQTIFDALQDPRRSIEDECGYPPINAAIPADLFRGLFDRDAIGRKVVELMPKHCWQATPTVFEDEEADKATQFEEDWDALEVGLSTGKSWHQDEEGGTIWNYLLRADILSGIGTFGVLLLGLDDGRNLQDPVEGVVTFNRRAEPVLNGPGRVVGHRIVNAGPPMPFMPDSPPAQHEVEALQAMVQAGEITVNTARWDPAAGKDRGGFRTEEVRHKAAFVNDWMTSNEQAAAEGKPPPFVDPDVIVNSGLPDRWQLTDILGNPYIVRRECQALVSSRAMTLNEWAEVGSQVLGHPVRVRPAGSSDFTANDAWGETKGDAGYGHGGPRRPTSRAKSAPGTPGAKEFLQQFGADPKDATFTPKADAQQAPPGARVRGNTPGTDDQYAWQGATPPAALAGTDQQYFGVYFGPSEAFPADGPTGRPTEKPTRKLIFLRPFDESLVQIVRYEWNIRNPRFGMPVMYRITLNDPREQHSGVGLPLATVFVHWSRVIHLADNLQSSEIFGCPRMRPVLNNVLGAKKAYGAGPEGYWKSAFTGFSFETNPQLGGDVLINKQEIQDDFEQYQNSLQRALITSGMTVRTLAPSVQDPGGQITAQLQAICIQLDCPMRVFMGSERGELASSQDDSQWNDVKRMRCLTYLTPKVICPLIDRLIAVGVLTEPEGYTVRWPDLEAMSDAQKAAILLQRTQAYAAYVSGNLESTIPPLDYMTRFDDMEEEEAQEIIDAAKQAHEDQDTMTMPPLTSGMQQEAPEGTQAAAEQDQAQQQHEDQMKQGQQQFEQQLQHEDQQADRAAGIAAPGQPNPQDQKMAAKAKAQAGLAARSKPAPSFGGKRPVTNVANGKTPVTDVQRVGRELASRTSPPQAMPGYGQIFIKENGSGECWYVGGDGDDDGFAKLVSAELQAIDGIDEVTCEAEAFPPRDQGWLQVYPKVRSWTIDDGATLRPKAGAYNALPSSQEQDRVLANRLASLQSKVWRMREWLGNLRKLAGVHDG